MLLANISVAKRLYHYFPNQAFLRNHPPPKEDMLDDMMHQCRSLGIEIDISSSKALSVSLYCCDVIIITSSFTGIAGSRVWK